jgi:hypothetical protein
MPLLAAVGLHRQLHPRRSGASRHIHDGDAGNFELPLASGIRRNEQRRRGGVAGLQGPAFGLCGLAERHGAIVGAAAMLQSKAPANASGRAGVVQFKPGHPPLWLQGQMP